MTDSTNDNRREKARARANRWAAKNRDKVNATSKAWRAKNKDRIRETQNAWAAEHRESKGASWSKWYETHKDQAKAGYAKYEQDHKYDPRRRFSKAKSAAKRRDIEFTLTLEEFSAVCVLPCFYCQDFLSHEQEYGSHIDRVDSAKGYSSDNIVSCCKVCNTIKNVYLTQEETQAAAKAIIEVRTNSRHNEISSCRDQSNDT